MSDLTFFQQHVRDFWNEDYDAVLAKYHMPSVVYSGGRQILFNNREEARASLHAYRKALINFGVTSTQTSVLARSISFERNHSVWVQFCYNQCDKGTATARYYLTPTPSGPQICMVEYLHTALGAERMSAALDCKAA